MTDPVDHITEVLADCVKGGWIVERRHPIKGPAFWLLTSPEGQVYSLMGLHRLTDGQIRNRVNGLLARINAGGRFPRMAPSRAHG